MGVDHNNRGKNNTTTSMVHRQIKIWFVGAFFDGASTNSNCQPPGAPIPAPHNPATVLVLHPLLPAALPRSLSHLQLDHKPLVH